MAGLTSVLAQAQMRSPFEVRVETPVVRVVPGEPTDLQVTVAVPPGHYLYKDATALQFTFIDGITAGEPDLPRGMRKKDPFLGKTVEIYTRNLTLHIPLTVPPDLAGQRMVTANLSFQGCSPTLCFRRETRPVAWQVTIGAVAASPAPLVAGTSVGAGSGRTIFDRLARPDFAQISREGRWLAHGLAFVGGLLTSFTPCVLPLIPVVLLFIGVQPGHARRNLLLSACLAGGIAVTAAVTGLAAALAGVPLAALFEQRWFLGVVMVIFLLMALSMFGLFSLRLPASWQSLLQRVGGRGPFGAFLTGISTGILSTPCAGPVVVGLITFVGVSHDWQLGVTLLSAYGIGFGLNFLLVGTFYGHLARRLPKGRLVRVAKTVLGLLLLLPALYYGWVLFGGGQGFPFGAQGDRGIWLTDESTAFAQAATSRRPVLIEFTARSCPPCLVMEQTTFRDPRVIDALAAQVIPLRLDMTFPNEALLATADRYQVVGWPALLFLAPDGSEFTNLRLVGKIVTAGELLTHIQQAAAMTRGQTPDGTGVPGRH